MIKPFFFSMVNDDMSLSFFHQLAFFLNILHEALWVPKIMHMYTFLGKNRKKGACSTSLLFQI